jgi:hypothetical protein
MTEQPTALQLADWAASYNTTMHNKAAAELRRLHAENELLGRACDKIRSMFKDERIELMHQRDQATAQRDELLEALRRIADPRNIHFAGDAQVVARAAIARAEGK